VRASTAIRRGAPTGIRRSGRSCFAAGWLTLGLAIAGCSASSTAVDAGQDAGVDAGPRLTDGGPLGAPCSSLDQCAGNPICALGQECPRAVICAAGICTAAGGPPVVTEMSLSFDEPKLPGYVQIWVLAPQLVAPATLDCSALLSGIDGGTLNPNLITQVNPLLQSYATNVESATKGTPLDIALQPSASGTGRVLYLEGYLRSSLADGGDELVGKGCSTFDNSTDGGSVAVDLNAP